METFRRIQLACVCAAAVVFCLAGTARAVDPAGPAYGVEPGDAPKNSVSIGAPASTAQTSGKPPASPAAPAAPSAAASPPHPSAPAAAPPAPVSTPGADAQSVDAPASGGPAAPGAVASTEVSDSDPRALTDFRPQLDPYGQWVEDPKYGLVWVPDRNVVGEGFSPYVTSGHWALDTGSNWVWVSDYPFGDVVFHYGRWVWTGGYGWSWVPGYQYAPAWVVWRVPTAEYAYVGWAPAPPLFVWWGGVGMGLWWGPPYYWAFCPSRFVFSRYTSYYVVHDRGFVRTLAGSTRRYISAAPHVGTAGPSMQSARIPSNAVPQARVPMASGHLAASSPAMRASYTPRPTLPGTSASRVVPYTGQRGFPSSRSYSTAGSYPTRTYSAAPRSYPPPAQSYPAYRGFSAPRTYSATPHYSAPARVYSPAPRVYSAPQYSAPAYRAAPSYHPSYSAPHMSAPHFSGGGGGGHHR